LELLAKQTTLVLCANEEVSCERGIAPKLNFEQKRLSLTEKQFKILKNENIHSCEEK
jgi:hypothetical protein